MSRAWLLCLLAAVCHSPASAGQFPDANWRRASPESQGLDSAVLAEALDFVRIKRIPLHSFLIVRNGVMVLEAYFWPYRGFEVHDVASVTKSLTSTAIGLAIDKGYVTSVDATLSSLLPIARTDSDPRGSRLSIRHLLTMTSGFDCNTEGGEKALAGMRSSPDWAAYAMSLPVTDEPGSQFAYCSCNNHLLSSIVTARTGMSMSRFMKTTLFDPLGIKDVFWPEDPKGRSHGWGDLHLHPADMARIGLLFLHEGQWGIRRVLSRDWIRAATREQVKVRSGVGYGYSWWINTARPPIYEAAGRGGQRISVLPKENMVLVFTGGGANTDEIAPFLFRAIQSNVAIPENPLKLQNLRRALSECRKEVAEPASSVKPVLARSVSGVVFSLSPNPLNLRSIRFDFKTANEAIANLGFGSSNWTVRVGLDGKRRFSRSGPHDAALAAVGRWLSASEFLLDIDTVANINHFVFRLQFERDRARILMTETTGEMTDVAVEGVAQGGVFQAPKRPQVRLTFP